ncbi:flavodoxin [Maribrevibacterium harenarium]|uniref:Flavodoxin n=1 Tax=Maribrevibacterium harenarium TaxID=2589817 RepID=A0A501WKT6_9GAMM|nr:flavodoxin [Maribrevibacterium harenarium]TPE48754.1 flavodoxin [Maribrevibacterium harenarium]
MNKVGIFYGTDTNNTEMVAGKIQMQLSELGIEAEMHNVVDIPIATMLSYDTLILGIPTWDFGGIQADWEDLAHELTQLNLSGKIVALYGLGDQFGYGDYFVDAMGWLYEQLKSTGAVFVGAWSTEGYDFEASRACNSDKSEFVGLAIDEDQQFDLTDQRIEQWVIQVYAEHAALAA